MRDASFRYMTATPCSVSGVIRESLSLMAVSILNNEAVSKEEGNDNGT
jgi:hypothetical protein